MFVTHLRASHATTSATLYHPKLTWHAQCKQDMHVMVGRWRWVRDGKSTSVQTMFVYIFLLARVKSVPNVTLFCHKSELCCNFVLLVVRLFAFYFVNFNFYFQKKCYLYSCVGVLFCSFDVVYTLTLGFDIQTLRSWLPWLKWAQTFSIQMVIFLSKVVFGDVYFIVCCLIPVCLKHNC